MQENLSVEITTQAQLDLKDDLLELIMLIEQSLFLAKTLNREYVKNSWHISSHIQKSYLLEIDQLIHSFLTLIDSLDKQIHLPNFDIDSSRIVKYNAKQMYRYLLTRLSALAVATEYQSPSSSHTLNPETGRFIGKYIANMNDYKRDYHQDEIPFEQKFKKEYIDGFLTLPIHTFLTSSGMASCTTILSFLLQEKKLNRGVLLGENTYFQCKRMILKTCETTRTPTVSIREDKTSEICEYIKSSEPSAIFLDSGTNSFDMTTPNLSVIVDFLVKTVRKDTYLVIDNTCLATSVQPYVKIFGKSRFLHLIVYESLNKYHQFGLDRVTAGVIWAYGKDTEKLFDYRRDLGTNITDASTYCLPLPNRIMLEKRLNRLERNTLYLAQFCEKVIKSANSKKLSCVSYCALPAHPSYSWMRHASFHGCFFVIQAKPQYDKTSTYSSLLKKIMNTAKEKNISLIRGTSFGFDITRIYHISYNEGDVRPFLRISVGTEDMVQIKRIGQVLEQVIRPF
ncbi:PLP-dependent transferase [Candidatus Gottesmanbacteria bacterium]|nr:PLP-dependent transferase [Candidatus Gottesmanbacteria bacterium]